MFPAVLACVTKTDPAPLLWEVFQQTCQEHYSDLADVQFEIFEGRWGRRQNLD